MILTLTRTQGLALCRLRGGEEAAAAKRTAGRRLRDGAEPPGCKPGEAPFHPLPTWLEPHLGSLYTSASDIDANDAGGSGANWRAGGAAGPKPSARGAAEGGLLRAPACVDRFRTDNSQFNNDMTVRSFSVVFCPAVGVVCRHRAPALAIRNA